MELSSEAVIVTRNEFPLKDEVSLIRKHAEELVKEHGSRDFIEEHGPVNVADEYEMKCEYLVGGAFESTAHCVVTSKKDNHIAAEAAWVFHIEPKFGVQGEPAIRFAYCYNVEDYKSRPDVFLFGAKYKSQADKMISENPAKFVCLEGFVDNVDVLKERKKELLGKTEETIEKALEEVGL